MNCVKCHTELTRANLQPDGSVICPGCGAIYRPRNKDANSTSSTTAEPPHHTHSFATSLQHTNDSTYEPRRTRQASDLSHTASQTAHVHTHPEFYKPIIVLILAVVIIIGIIAVVTIAKNNKSDSTQSTGNSDSVSLFESADEKGLKDLLSRLQIAYNSQDLYGIVQCFDPSVSDATLGIIKLFGLNDAFKSIIPFASKVIGASGIIDNSSWGTCKLSIVEFSVDGSSGSLTYQVAITYNNGTTNTFNDTANIMKVSDTWYFSAIQPVNPNLYTNGGTESAPGYRSLTSAEPFSEDRAWVTFSKDGTRYSGVIDTQGNLIYVAKGYAREHIPFTDGYSFFEGKVIDINGNIVFELPSNDSESGKYLGLGGGTLLYTRHITTFTENKYEFYAVELSSGNARLISSEDEFYTGQSFVYIGDNIFHRRMYHGDLTEICNVSTGNYFSLSNTLKIGYNHLTPDICTSFYNGIAIEEHGYVVPSSCLTDKQTADNYIASSISLSPMDLIDPWDYGDGLLAKENGTWVDTSGNVAVQIPTFPNSVTLSEVGPFSGGFAPILLKGADGFHYITLIDRTGTMQYDPIKKEDNMGGDFIKEYFSYHGYLSYHFAPEGGFITPTGTTITIAADDLTVFGNDAVINFYYTSGTDIWGSSIIKTGKISCGMICYNDDKRNEYISLDRRRDITSVYY